jgi:hypothetical protein
MPFDLLLHTVESRRFTGDTNLVLIAARSGNIKVAKGAMSEYTALVMSISMFLRNAAMRADAEGWTEIATELRRKIEEEDGSQTNGVPHCVILSDQFYEIGLEWRGEQLPFIDGYDTTQEPPVMIDLIDTYSPSTVRFITDLMEMSLVKDSSNVVGMALALDMSAGQELCTVAKILNEILRDGGLPEIPEEAMNDGSQASEFDKFTLNGFFAHHIHAWEEGHRAGLERAIAETEGVVEARIMRGFMRTMSRMDIWWRALAK